MKNIFTIFLLTICSHFLYSQIDYLPKPSDYSERKLPENIRQIIRYENDSILLSIREYDQDKNIIFSYGTQHVGSRKFKGTRLIFIRGQIFNEEGLLLKSYHLHSNAYIFILNYEYDSINRTTRIYMNDLQFENHKELINTNPYYFISEIQSFNQLLEDSIINKIESGTTPYLQSIEHYNEYGTTVEDISLDSKGDTTNIRQFDYDKHNNPICKREIDGQIIESESFYSYDQNMYDDFDEKPNLFAGNLLQNVRIIYNWRTKQRKVSSITFYKYDIFDRLEEIITYEEGVSSKKQYIYDDENFLECQINYDSDDQITSKRFYEYDEYGNIIYEISNNFKTGTSTENKYQYSFEYY